MGEAFLFRTGGINITYTSVSEEWLHTCLRTGKQATTKCYRHSIAHHPPWTHTGNIRRKLFYCLTSGATRVTQNLFFNTSPSYCRPSLMLVILPTSFTSPWGFRLLCSITVGVPRLTNTSTSYRSRKNCFSISAQALKGVHHSRVFLTEEANWGQNCTLGEHQTTDVVTGIF